MNRKNNFPATVYQEEWAEKIIKSVNNHDELVEALKEARDKVFRHELQSAINHGASTDKAKEHAEQIVKPYDIILKKA